MRERSLMPQTRLGPIALAVLICAGQIKESPLFEWLPIDLTLLSAGLVLVAILISRFQGGPTTGRVLLPIALWLLLLPAASLSSFDSYATTKIATLFTVTLIIAVAPFYLLRHASQRSLFLRCAAIIAAVIAVTALFIDPTSASEYNNRAILDGANTIGTARVAMSGAIIMILFALEPGRRPRTRVWLVIAALLTSTLGLLTGSRGPVLAAVAAILIVIIAAPVVRKFRGRAIIAFVVVGFIAVWIAVSNGSDGFGRILSTILGESGTSGNARIGMWDQSIEMIKNNPWGLGWGMYMPPGADHGYPHNLILEVGVEAGWLPMLAVTLLLIATLLRGARVSNSMTSAAIYALFIFGVINALLSADVNGTRIMWAALFAIWVIPINADERWFYSTRREYEIDSFNALDKQIYASPIRRN